MQPKCKTNNSNDCVEFSGKVAYRMQSLISFDYAQNGQIEN